MVKARILAIVMLGVMLFSVFIPGTSTVASLASPPDPPTNVSPDNGTLEIGPMHQFFTADYSGVNEPLNAQWQIVRSDTEPSLQADGSYDTPLWDSGLVNTGDVPSYSMPTGLLDYDQKYWWHVRVQDVTGAWSPWSIHTWFKIIANSPPNQPSNLQPADLATDVSMTPVLKASDFTDPDSTAYVALGESLAASQWQITTTPGSYATPVADSTVKSTATSATIAGSLAAGTKYYWHVRYQDTYGNWSAWSLETSFTTKGISKPVADFSADKSEVIGGEDLVTFTESSTPAGEIDRWTWDFGDGTAENWTYLTRPSTGAITHKYSAADGGTKTVKLTVYNSAATAGVSKSLTLIVHTKPAASFTASPAAGKAGEEITITDASTPPEDITSWEWQFSDGTTESWDRSQRDAAGGVITHTFGKSGTHTVSLTVKGALGESFYSKEIRVTGGGGFGFGLWMIAVAVAVVAVVAGAVYMVRSRKAK